jgi:hypothetical protein
MRSNVSSQSHSMLRMRRALRRQVLRALERLPVAGLPKEKTALGTLASVRRRPPRLAGGILPHIGVTSGQPHPYSARERNHGRSSTPEPAPASLNRRDCRRSHDASISRSTGKAERYRRERIDLSVSTLADQVGASTTVLQPLHALIERHVLAAERLHGDDTTVPILAKGKTVTGHIWTYPNFLNWREKVSNINGCIAEVSTTGGGVGREPSLLAR